MNFYDFPGTHQDPKETKNPKIPKPKDNPTKKERKNIWKLQVSRREPFWDIFPKGATTYVEAAINSKSDRNM